MCTLRSMTRNAANLVVETLKIRMNFKRPTECAAESQRPASTPSHRATPQGNRPQGWRTKGGSETDTVVANLKCAGVVSSLVSRHLQQQPCSSLAGVMLLLRHATNLAASTPQLQWLGGALVRCGEGRGPAPFFVGGGQKSLLLE